MSALRSTFVEVYVFRRAGHRAEFLCLRRARAAELPGVWQPITGKRRRSERAWAAAVREVREETGLSPERWWALETPTVYYDARSGEVLALPVFAAQMSAAGAVRLSREHDAWAFLPAREAGRRFLWEAQRRALADIRRQVLRRGPLADALELPPRTRRGARGAAASRPTARPARRRARIRRRRPRPA